MMKFHVSQCSNPDEPLAYMVAVVDSKNTITRGKLVEHKIDDTQRRFTFSTERAIYTYEYDIRWRGLYEAFCEFWKVDLKHNQASVSVGGLLEFESDYSNSRLIERR